MSERTNLELARAQIAAAREYTLTLLEDVAEEDWFLVPNPSVTHLAWQVGHLAMAEYGLCLFRIRGRQPEDLKLMPGRFRKRFSRGSAPSTNPEDYPPPAEIRSVFDTIHEQTLNELETCDPDRLNEKIEPPHAVFETKLGALFFCAHHEMLHAGQIGLLRRLTGKSPVR
jgi:hypothetical protein